MGPFNVPELLVILVIILVLFGVGRISKIGEELGKGVKAFRDGVREGKDETAVNPDEQSHS